MCNLSEELINEKNFKTVWEKIEQIQEEYRVKFNNFNYNGVSDKEVLCFYEQLKTIRNMRWIGEKPEEIGFNRSYSSIPKMEREQFMYYMYYRTRMLEGHCYSPRFISYVYTFAYELSTGIDYIEIERVEEILNYLISGLHDDYGLANKLSRWNPDIIRIYENKKLGKQPENAFTISYKKTELVLWENVANYFIEESDFIKEYNLLSRVNEVLVRICSEFDKIMLPDVDIIGCMVGNLEKNIDYEKFLPTSIWNRQVKSKFMPKECVIIQYNPSHSEKVDIVDDYGNTIKRVDIRIKEVEINFALYVLKSIEIAFGNYTEYRTRLRKPQINASKAGIKTKTYEGLVTYYSSNQRKRDIQYTLLCAIPDIIKLVDNTIDDYIVDNKIVFDEVRQSVASMGMGIKKNLKKNAKEEPLDSDKVTLDKLRTEVVDKNTLQAAREVLYKNQERLVVDEEPVIESTVQQPIIEQKFSKYEVDLIKKLLNHEDLLEFEKTIETVYSSINILVEKINEKSLEIMGDIVISDNTGTIELIEDYTEICKKWVNYYG